ncbi:putative alpha-farnesene synthase [Lupinus albus]|uniref:Putative alpha-farnesene synthase n=1 Tax=Lupinus albus TaxID=3870 RepID=A0A6A4P000_LUPAL|nr:putative alpha-farnesene synthase [Lupinus albus]
MKKETMTSNNNINVRCRSFKKEEDNRRRSANYKPNIWKHAFLQSLPTNYHKEESDIELVRMLIEVKGIFVEKSGVLQKLELVDWIQKLGVANYFEKEVREFLESTNLSFKNNKNPISAEESLHVAALSFRLLRQHGYKVSPGTLERCS